MLTNKKFWIAGIASSMMLILSAPIAMAYDDYRSSSRDNNSGIIPPYMRERENDRYNRDANSDRGIVPPYIRDKVETNRSKGW